MCSNSHQIRPSRPRLFPAGQRLLAVAAGLCALVLAVSACALPTVQTGGSNNGGFSSGRGSVTVGTGGSTPVKILRGGGGTAMVLVPVTIDGQGPYDFALDTGAGITLIDTQLANELRLPVTGASAEVAGVGGTQNITPVHVDTWHAGKISLPAANIGKTELSSFKSGSGVRGLLGSDILSRFGRVTINYDTGELSVSSAAAIHIHGVPAGEPWVAIAREALRQHAA